jgi:hypothetical protein
MAVLFSSHLPRFLGEARGFRSLTQVKFERAKLPDIIADAQKRRSMTRASSGGLAAVLENYFDEDGSDAIDHRPRENV